MSGTEIQQLLKHHRIFQWELARKINISEFTLSRWLRDSLTADQTNQVLNAINQILEERKTNHEQITHN